DLSVVEHLDLLARAHRVDEADDLVRSVLTDVGLLGQASQLPGTLSSGQRRRLALATAFVRPRKLLVMDEPEQRLDEAGLEWLALRLKHEKANGLSVLLASHDAGLVEAVADDVHQLESPA
ncbi:MAG: ABC transporter ATP-binding protein, partial [Nocardioidaceae bacterium]